MRLIPMLALMLVAVAASPAQARHDDPPEGRTLRCESNDGRTRECQVDAGGGVRLLRQLSKAPCIEGQSWGHVRGAIWVTQGCRGEFLAISDSRYGGAYGGGPWRSQERLLRCESKDGRWSHCDADVRRGAELVRQMSRNACIRGQSWGTDPGGLWVTGGCRAEFRVGWGVGGSAPPPVATRFRCESEDGRVRSCGVSGRGTVRFVRQLSRAACIEGRSWGVDRGGVWVDGGCRAEFEVVGGWDGRG